MATIPKIDVHNVVVISSVCLVVWIIASRITSSIEARKFKKQHGCKPAAKLAQVDPFLGLDVLKVVKQNADNRTTLEANYLRSLEEGLRTMTLTMMGRTIISTCEPENVKCILATNFKDFAVGPRLSALGQLMGSGIFTTDGNHWEHSRAIVRPSFTRAQVADLESIETHVQNLVRRVPTDGEIVDIQHLFFNFTIDNSTEFLLGRSINCQTTPNMEYFTEAWDYAEKRSNDRLRLGKLGFLLRDGKFDKSCEIVHQVVDDYIAESLNGTQDNEMKSKRRYNLLAELAGAIKDPVQLRNELLNVLLAARDTTAGLLSSVMYFLSRHPEVWAKLEAEVDQLGGKVPDYDELKNMRYLRSILDETLRLHPPVPLNMRFATRNTTLPRGGGPDGTSPVFVPKGTGVSYAVWTVHRLPEIYGPNAQDFYPGRWMDSEKPLRPGWAFLPFNGGPRICLGQQSALVETSYVVTRLVQTFKRLEPRGADFRENLSLTLSHHDGVKLAVWRR